MNRWPVLEPRSTRTTRWRFSLRSPAAPGGEARGSLALVLDEELNRVLEPSYLDGLSERTLEAVRETHDEDVELENRVSYVRRLAQGRIDIVAAELQRRATGGSVDELVASLPAILAGGEGRSGAANTRVSKDLAPEELGLDPDAARLITDATLADLPDRSVEQLESTLEELRTFEHELSARRRALHSVIDRVERELAARLAIEA